MRLISGDEFGKALVAAGVIDDYTRVRRVVIDAQAGHAVTIYVERFGDERLLNVVQTLEGVEIKGVPA